MSPLSVPGLGVRSWRLVQKGEAQLGPCGLRSTSRGEVELVMGYMALECKRPSEQGCPTDSGAIGVEVGETPGGGHGGRGGLRAAWKHPHVESRPAKEAEEQRWQLRRRSVSPRPGRMETLPARREPSATPHAAWKSSRMVASSPSRGRGRGRLCEGRRWKPGCGGRTRGAGLGVPCWATADGRRTTANYLTEPASAERPRGRHRAGPSL